MSEEFLTKANQIMDDAVEKAGELLCTKPAVAEVILRQLLKCDPEHLSGLQLLGLCKHRMGDNAEAVEIIQTALELDPTNADNHNNLGLAYAGLGNHHRAIDSIKQAIQYKPEQFLFKNNLALQYRCIGEYENAVKTLEEALVIEGRCQLWLNLGGIYGEMKNVAKARECFEASLRVEPEYPAAHVDLAFAYHLAGDWQRGFAEYEWRFFYYPQMKYYMGSYDQTKLWHGHEDLNGKRVLIYGEQGLGDIIQFARYTKDLKDLGAHVIVHCPNVLNTLLKKIDGVDEVFNRDIVNETGDAFPEYDYQLSMMSLPHLLKKTELSGQPYIKVETDSFLKQMEKEYPNLFRVGIIWAGSPAHPHDQKRSFYLKNFENIQNIPGVKLFNLQLDVRPRQYGVTYRNMKDGDTSSDDPLSDKFQASQNIVNYCEGCEHFKMVDLTNLIKTFDDTATLLTGLDLVICCDTATAHLAGAMGIPCWVLLPFNPDWRWLIDGSTTEWYESLRLYRQPERDDWKSVFQKVEDDLKEMVAE